MVRVIVLTLLLSTFTFAHHMELVTDRPDRTESSHLVPQGFIQLESGWGFARHKDGNETEERHEILGSLVRFGLTERVELRLGWNGYIRQKDQHNGAGIIEKGAGDAQVGTKIYLWNENGTLPEAAFLANVSVPLGNEKFSSNEPDPSFRYSFSHTLTENFSLGYNLGASWVTEVDETKEKHTEAWFNYSATTGVGLTSRLGLFVEAFGNIPFNSGGMPANNFDGGLTYLMLDNLQLDLAVGAGLSKNTDDWFLGLGISLRLPK